jgi:UDP-N-acetylglucosamine 4,6-dehydratase/5-epimerase
MEFSDLNWRESVVLVTGGTGSFGQMFTQTLLRDCKPAKLIVFSRDELKQHDMRQRFNDDAGSPMRYFIGDVRDVDRLRRAMHGVDIVVHAAALKQVPACEYNPFEAVLTNVNGAKNVIDAAIDSGVKRVLAISTDKAVNPVNLYGATKLCAEKLFVQGNAYAGRGGTRFACARYGNVVGSRGSVIPVFQQQRSTGRIRITDARMTRFWLTLEQGVQFVIRSIERMHGGEIFVPRIPSMNIMDLAKTVAPECEVEFMGVRPGEKIHEVLISDDESRRTREFDDHFVVLPEFPLWDVRDRPTGGRTLPEGYRYASDTNPECLTEQALKGLIAKV